MMELGILPAGWETAELSEICLVNPTIDKSSISDDLAVSFVPMPAVEAESGGIDVSATRKFGEVKKGYTPFREGDVLFAKITPCMENGKMAVVPALHNGLGFGSTEFHVLRAHSGISPQFVYFFVSSRAFRHVAEHNMSGAVGQRRVTTPYLSACKIPVPPTTEQHRIVAKIEELFSELDQGVASLKTAREQLKVYRQSLLKNAFEGKLTAAWRAAHRNQLETATALQQRVARERQARYQQQLADWQTAGQAGPKPKPPKPLPPLTAEELAELPELPAGWGWIRPEEIASQEPYSIGIGPFGSNLKSEHYVEDGDIYVIESSFATQGVLEISNLKTITHEHFKSIARSETKAGDIIIAKIGAQFGKCSILRMLDKPAVVSGNSLKLSVNEDVMNVELVCWQLVNLKQQGAIDLIVNLTAQPALSLGSMNELPILVPPKTEQIQIVGALALKLEQYDSLVSEARTAITLLQERRTALISAAVTGQIDVRGLATRGDAAQALAILDRLDRQDQDAAAH